MKGLLTAAVLSAALLFGANATDASELTPMLFLSSECGESLFLLPDEETVLVPDVTLHELGIAATELTPGSHFRGIVAVDYELLTIKGDDE